MMNTRVNLPARSSAQFHWVFLAAGAFHQRDHLYREKTSPISVVTFTLILSLSTLVPPVTLLLSPPASRITGALSPGNGAFINGGEAFDDLPVEGMISPASQMNTSPFTNRDEGTIVISFTYISPQPAKSLAGVSSLVFLRLLACALPLASANASAKLANNNVMNNIAVTIGYTAGFPAIVHH